MRHGYLVAAVVALGLSLAPDSPAQSFTPTPVTVNVIGKGKIRLIVADGSSRPCDASGNKVLFDGHARAGDEIKVAAATGSVCVDHTYGSMRESQWAGASIWSGSSAGWTGARALSGSVSTDEP
ncbi:MAG TPA: hypothetical protein VGL81_02595 [Polyangiaceae bacterium]|jgi:hypothetical protein